MSIFETGIRPAVDAYLKKQAEEKRDYGEYWSASSAGYCMRKQIFERLKVPQVSDDARKTRVFEVGDIFHEFMQRITKNAGLSVAQELELQDEGLMVRGHIDDLVLVPKKLTIVSTVGSEDIKHERAVMIGSDEKQLILYDYKTQNSRAFSYQKDRPMSHYHKMQVGTYMYMLRQGRKIPANAFDSEGRDVSELSEARILKISKDDLRMSEQQLMWSPELEKEIVGYWSTLNGYWKAKTIPKCTCADYEGGFLARQAYNPFFYEGEPCSVAWAKNNVDLDEWSY